MISLHYGLVQDGQSLEVAEFFILVTEEELEVLQLTKF